MYVESVALTVSVSQSPILDAHLAHALPRSSTQRVWQPGDEPLPAVYFGHGAPPLLDDALWMGQLFDWISTMPKPRGIIIVSAHWESAPLMISATAPGTPLVYDFSGFEQRFFEMTYVTPDASALAAQVAALMPDTEPLHQHSTRGLDHGAWVPLSVMYPLGDVPVLQLSMPSHDPQRLMEIGARLRELRHQGVLVMGSGFLTHGLPFLSRENWANPAAPPPSWSVDFDAWAADALLRGDVEELAQYRDRAPGMPYAHPTVEHFTPLFVALGAATVPDSPATTTIDGFFMGLAKRSVQMT
jgi:4,5-DOPA dioxygenase extradiol